MFISEVALGTNQYQPVPGGTCPAAHVGSFNPGPQKSQPQPNPARANHSGCVAFIPQIYISLTQGWTRLGGLGAHRLFRPCRKLLNNSTCMLEVFCTFIILYMHKNHRCLICIIFILFILFYLSILLHEDLFLPCEATALFQQVT